MATAFVKLTTHRAGPGFQNFEGEVIEVDEREARTLVATNQAEWVRPATAATGPPENAMRPKAAFRPKR